MRQRKNIALFIGMLETEFSHDICEGALLGANEIDANLFVLPGGIINVNYAEQGFDVYRRQYNILYSYAQACPFDAIIVEYGTITSLLDYDEKLEFLEQFGDVPIVLIAGDFEGYSSITIDNKKGMQEAVSHLIESHQCRKIGFVSGPKTNQDARERLQAYEETMGRHNLAVKDSWILYSDFSEYCDDAVEEFIVRNPGLEAIVFANDQMALSGYRAMERLGLKPGTDILVTGFDDSPLAMMMEPHLTSVKVEPKEMGYHAVIEALDAMKGQEVHYNVKPRLVIRESCGCNDTEVVEKAVDNMLMKMNERKIKQLAGDMLDICCNAYLDNAEKLQAVECVEQYFEYVLDMMGVGGEIHTNRDEFFEKYRMYMSICQQGNINLKEFLLMDQIVYSYMCKQIKGEADRLRLLEWIAQLRRELTDNVSTKKIVTIEETKIYELVMANIASEMIYYTNEEQVSYHSVVKKLQKMGFSSSCIMLFKNSIRMPVMGHWKIPDRLYVKGYHGRGGLHVDHDKGVSISDIFVSGCIPSERRFDMLVIPLFANDVQYGFIMVESDMEYFQYAIQVACQVSIAIEVLDILEKQNQIKQKLEQSLEKSVENNRILDEMSRSDPLTEILNRRGFLDCVKKIVENSGNYGKKAIAIYADMDSLKVINDEFGHDEGDFSLKLIAQALSNSFRKSDVVARMGGDEFAAFAIVNRDDFPNLIKARIQSALAELNEDSGKPYYVGISIGTAEFMIRENTNVEEMLTRADEKLYLEKKNKVKILYKSEMQ